MEVSKRSVSGWRTGRSSVWSQKGVGNFWELQLLRVFEMQMPSGRGGYEECVQFAVKLRSAFAPVGHAAISQMSLSQTQRETDTESDRQTDTEGARTWRLLYWYVSWFYLPSKFRVMVLPHVLGILWLWLKKKVTKNTLGRKGFILCYIL